MKGPATDYAASSMSDTINVMENQIHTETGMPVGHPPQAAGSASVFASLEAALSPAAKHAYETFLYAFWLPGQSMTMGELRDALRKLYGEEVARELEQHFHDRREAVLPNIKGSQRRGQT